MQDFVALLIPDSQSCSAARMTCGDLLSPAAILPWVLVAALLPLTSPAGRERLPFQLHPGCMSFIADKRLTRHVVPILRLRGGQCGGGGCGSCSGGGCGSKVLTGDEEGEEIGQALMDATSSEEIEGAVETKVQFSVVFSALRSVQPVLVSRDSGCPLAHSIRFSWTTSKKFWEKITGKGNVLSHIENALNSYDIFFLFRRMYRIPACPLMARDSDNV